MDVSLFLLMHGKELGAYCEEVLSSSAAGVGSTAVHALHDAFPFMDAEHLVYGIEIGMRAAPGVFVSHTIRLLEHVDAAVCSAAFRAIYNSPPEIWTAEMIAQLDAVQLVKLQADLSGLGQIVSVGTNEAFVSRLRSRFSGPM